MQVKNEANVLVKRRVRTQYASGGASLLAERLPRI